MCLSEYIVNTWVDFDAPGASQSDKWERRDPIDTYKVSF